MTKQIDTNEIRQRMADCDVSEEDILALCDEIDRMRGEKQTPPQGKTVRVMVAVAISADEDWMAIGSSGFDNSSVARLLSVTTEGECKIHWLTADLPVPEEVEVKAEVHTATTDENATSGGRG